MRNIISTLADGWENAVIKMKNRKQKVPQMIHSPFLISKKDMVQRWKYDLQKNGEKLVGNERRKNEQKTKQKYQFFSNNWFHTKNN